MNFFVSGGSRGIGEAIVLAAVAAGHDVAFTFISSEERAHRVVERARGVAPERKCRAYRLDVTSSAEVEAVGDAVLADFDTVHAVVANAGVTSDALVASMTDEQWHSVLSTNLTGAFYVVRYFLPTFLANRFGRIVLVSSLGHGGVSGQANYAASKAGLLGLSATLAKEYGRKGITSNVVMPGFVETDMTRASMSAHNREFWMKYCPAGRTGEPADVAGVVLFLASEAAAFVNGQSIAITGGLDWAP